MGLQSEMDALPKLGHACGHNLIAVSGVAVALGLKAAMVAHGIAGRIVLLGTPGTWGRSNAGLMRYSLVCLVQRRSTAVARSSCSNEAATMTWTSASCEHPTRDHRDTH